ncbi:hypothetical protein [Solimonas marina]|uniref:Uncharacterized protein n=1 Tax=Solimonas marina TaxID=2714601 RepID=A0A969WAK0_9GAMM|nr:hypothetical protein [Solimonas marina]NKF21345.1 hypothetical protein [Solimonas marina]
MKTSSFIKPLSVLALLLAFNAAHADDKLIDVPNGIAAPQALNTVKHALSEQQWSVTNVGPNAISAVRKEGLHDASITVAIANGALVYEAEARPVLTHSPHAFPATVTAAVPSRWIDALRSQVQMSLVSLAVNKAGSGDAAGL